MSLQKILVATHPSGSNCDSEVSPSPVSQAPYLAWLITVVIINTTRATEAAIITVTNAFARDLREGTIRRMR